MNTSKPLGSDASEILPFSAEPDKNSDGMPIIKKAYQAREQRQRNSRER